MTERRRRPATELVHGGSLRSQWAETSEALFLTQGFVYASAEEAEARFLGTSPGYQYSRFGNPTVTMFEERMRLLEGAEAARATATGMAAVTAAIQAGSGAVVKLLLALGTWVTLRRFVLKPVEALSRTSRSLAGGNLEARSDLVGDDELSSHRWPSRTTLSEVRFGGHAPDPV